MIRAVVLASLVGGCMVDGTAIGRPTQPSYFTAAPATPGATAPAPVPPGAPAAVAPAPTRPAPDSAALARFAGFHADSPPTTEQLPGWPMPPPPPAGWVTVARKGHPLVYGDARTSPTQGTYSVVGLPVDYAVRAARAWGHSSVKVEVYPAWSRDASCADDTVCDTSDTLTASGSSRAYILHVNPRTGDAPSFAPPPP